MPPLSHSKERFEGPLIARRHQALAGVQYRCVITYQHATPVLANRVEDSVGCLFRRGPGDAIEKFRNFLLAARGYVPHITHSAITRNVGLDAARVHAGCTDTASLNVQFFAQRLGELSMAIYFDPPLANKIDPPFIV